MNSKNMATPGRLERPTHSLEGCCSIQLSYGAALKFFFYYNINNPSENNVYLYQIKLEK